MVTEFWSIPNLLVKCFYGLALVTVVIFFLGVWDKIRIWAAGMDADQELRGMGAVGLLWLSVTKFFSADCLFAKRVFPRSTLRGLMLIGVVWGFTLLFFGTVGRTINHWFFQFLSGRTWLLFSFTLDVAGALALIGTGFQLYRKYLGKPDRMVKSSLDGVLLLLLFFAILSGFAVEGTRLAVLSPPSSDWSPVGHVFGAVIGSVGGTGILKPIYLSFWIVHFLLAFSFIAYIPFSKYGHIFAGQITTYLFENKWREKEIPSEWVFSGEIERYKKKRTGSVTTRLG